MYYAPIPGRGSECSKKVGVYGGKGAREKNRDVFALHWRSTTPKHTRQQARRYVGNIERK